MAAVASGWLAREMSLLAAEAERRYTEELETLRHRLQECETERMQTQLEMMRLESRAHDSDAQRDGKESCRLRVVDVSSWPRHCATRQRRVSSSVAR